MNLFGAAALIVGGSSGLGAACAADLTTSGTEVFVFDRQPPRADTPTDGCTYLPGDVTDYDGFRDATATANHDGKLRLVINCAGIGSATRTVNRRHEPHNPVAWQQVLDVNLTGSFHALTLGASEMSRNEAGADGERGVVILTASIAAFDGQVGQLAYTASKAAVAGMVLPAARDLAPSGIRVCAIAPGTFDTPLLQTVSPGVRDGILADAQFPRRAGEPAEFARLVRSIAEIGYMNGEVIRLDAAARLRPS